MMGMSPIVATLLLAAIAVALAGAPLWAVGAVCVIACLLELIADVDLAAKPPRLP